MNLQTLLRPQLLASPKSRAILSLLIGLAMTFAYAPFSQGWLAPILLALWLLILVRSQTSKQALSVGFGFGFGWFAGGVSWVFVSIDQFGGLPLPISVLLMALLWAYLALYPMLASWLWFISRRWLSGLSLFALPVIWLLTEFARGWVMTGFPWLSLGYTQTDTVLGQLAPHLGEIGITLVVLLSGIAFAMTVLRKHIGWLLLPLGLYATALYAPYLNPMQPTGESINVALVQGNVELDLKWDPAKQWQHLHTYEALTEPYLDDHDVIVWPESAITIIEDRASYALSNLDERLRNENTALLTGIIDWQIGQTRQGEYYNSVIVLGNQSNPEGYYYGNENRYEKHQLLPIGEFVPFESILRPLAPLFNLPMSSFSRGAYQQANLDANGVQIAANICYEVAFPRYIRANMDNQTQLLMTVSNDSWFGNSHGPHQHMEIARMRAMELGRPMLRSTNSGITALVDERGRFIDQVEAFIPAVASGRVALVEGHTWFSRFGELPAWILSLGLAVLALRRPRKMTTTANKV